MERLTSYKNECGREMICRHEDCMVDGEHCPHMNEDVCPCLQDILNKLAEYEDLEDKLNKQFNGCIGMEAFVDSIIEYDKLFEKDEELAEAMMITNDEVRKFREWESLDKQGRLLKLPCKIGDTVYVIPSKANYELNILGGRAENNRVYEQIVNRIEISEYGYLLSTCEGRANVLERFYKETWFLTKKEAETA